MRLSRWDTGADYRYRSERADSTLESGLKMQADRDAVSTRPEATVVIPTRDRWPLLARNALPSALSQEDVDLEVIVVDDGSIDGTADKLEALAMRELRLVRLPTSRGVSHARNAGLREARGEWVAFLDDDDLWSPRKLRTQIDTASGATFVYCSAAVVRDDGVVLEVQAAPDPSTVATRLLEQNVVPGGGSGAIVRTSAALAIGGFDERLSILADWDLWIRLSDAGDAAACPG